MDLQNNFLKHRENKKCESRLKRLFLKKPYENKKYKYSK